MVARKRRRLLTPLEEANQLTDESFIAAYLAEGLVTELDNATTSRNDTLMSSRTDPAWQDEWEHPNTREEYQLGFVRASKLTEADLEACLALVEETSRPDYENSTKGWQPAKKRKEMKSADLRYILVKDPEDTLRGFTSLMLTYEEGQPVVYCYEIHLKPELQGCADHYRYLPAAET